jgi:hypothetical protein
LFQILIIKIEIVNKIYTIINKMTTSHTSFPDVISEPDIYCPEYVFQRKTSTHTLRQRNYTCSPEHVVTIKRPRCEDGIPITELDQYLSDKSIYSSGRTYGKYVSENEVSLGKKEMYEAFLFYSEEFCSSKTVTYDRTSNMTKTTYQVPIIGYFASKFGNTSYSHSPISAMVDMKMANDEKFIMVNRKMYSLDKYYREVGLDYVEVNVPANYSTDTNLDDGEHYYSSDKVACFKDNITYSFHHEVNISSLIIKPEKMSFKHVHGDNTYSRFERRNPSLMRKPKYFINVLENEPGFISKFELQYRSELTHGQWFKHGIYNGNISMADCVKISFDEIQVKEVRIVPISFHKSFEKVQIKFVGNNTVQVTADDVFVIYELSTPRDGKYLTYSSKVLEKSNISKKSFEKDLKRWRYGKKHREHDDMINDCIHGF